MCIRDSVIYHAGDTGLFGDIALLGRLYNVNTALLPIGGTFTMDVDEAVEAVKLLKCDQVIPMHYDTFPPVEADPEEFKKKIQAATDTSVIILKPGEAVEVK